MNLDVSREVIRQNLERSRAVNPSTYRIGNKLPEIGLYEVLGMDGSVIGYGRKIYNAPAVYGDIVRATKPYGSNVWSLDRLNLPIDDDGNLETPQDGDLEPPEDPPEDPPPPPFPPPTNGQPTKPPEPVAPPTFFSPPPKPSTSPDNCEPPPPGCDWQDASIPCNGVNKGFVDLPNGSRVILCCDESVNVPPNLGCAPSRFTCSGGSCFPDQNGVYPNYDACIAGLAPPPFDGGQRLTVYRVVVTFQALANGVPLGGLSTSTFFPTGAIGGLFEIEDESPTGFFRLRFTAFSGANELEVAVIRKIDGNQVPQTGTWQTTFTVTPLDGLPDESLPPTCP